MAKKEKATMHASTKLGKKYAKIHQNLARDSAIRFLICDTKEYIEQSEEHIEELEDIILQLVNHKRSEARRRMSQTDILSGMETVAKLCKLGITSYD